MVNIPSCALYYVRAVDKFALSKEAVSSSSGLNAAESQHKKGSNTTGKITSKSLLYC